MRLSRTETVPAALVLAAAAAWHSSSTARGFLGVGVLGLLIGFIAVRMDGEGRRDRQRILEHLYVQQ